MTIQEKQALLERVIEKARYAGLIKSQRDFASLLKCSEASISKAMKGNEKYLSDNFIAKIMYINTLIDNGKIGTLITDVPEEKETPEASILVIPTEAMAGTIGEFATSVSAYDCERMISPIKGADYAIKIYGDSMSPEYPSGSIVLIKKINEEAFIEWGRVYVLDTENGAVIKSIRRTELDDVVECVSSNPAYQPFRINMKYIRGWYRVLMVLSLK